VRYVFTEASVTFDSGIILNVTRRLITISHLQLFILEIFSR
jgi:hypothetical protein